MKEHIANAIGLLILSYLMGCFVYFCLFLNVRDAFTTKLHLDFGIAYFFLPFVYIYGKFEDSVRKND